VSTAVCLTPDRQFFGPAVRGACRVIELGLPRDTDLFLICEEADVWPHFGEVNRDGRIILLTADFTKLLPAELPAFAGSKAIYRRLILDRILPERYERIITMDSDVMAAREGVAPLAAVDLGPYAFAAAPDMIYYMDFGSPLAGEFRAHRQAIGLDAETPYFNSGVMVIDRRRWVDEELGRRAIDLAISNAKLRWIEQDALNVLVKGRFARLSPRWDFMGDFLLLDLEKELAPVLYHFVNRPKPWQKGYAGEARYCRFYADWFAETPWAGFAAEPARPVHAAVNWAFRTRLLSHLRSCVFADGWRI
jgi:lipopolysaccharide biosynthesis glycosyltransferase